MLIMNREQAEAVADALTKARALKACVMLLSRSPNKPDPLLIQQAMLLDAALTAVEASRENSRAGLAS